MTSLPMNNPAANGMGRKRRDLLELSVGYGLILVAIWTPRPWQLMIDCIAFAWIMLASVISFDGWHAMGLRISASLRSVWMIGVALLLAAAAVALAGRLHTLHLPGFPVMFVRRYWAYAIWAFLQQFLLLDFVLMRLLRLLPGIRAAVLGAAGLFAVAHLPNPILTPATFVWALVACLLFLHFRNLYTLAIAHAILGICMSVTIPGTVDHNMRVGLSYLTYRPPHRHYRSQNDHIVSTEAWVIADAPTRRR